LREFEQGGFHFADRDLIEAGAEVLGSVVGGVRTVTCGGDAARVWLAPPRKKARGCGPETSW
jgi:hypothetical protein